MSENLYELSTELAIIYGEIAVADGELSETLEAQLDAVSLAVKDKIQNIGKWTLNLDGRTEAIDKEIARLEHKKRMTENLSKRLQEYVKMCMTKADMKKLEYTTFSVAVQKNPPSVEIVNEEAVPNTYKIIKQTIAVDKKKLLDDLKAGQKVEGCTLVTDKTHLRIR